MASVNLIIKGNKNPTNIYVRFLQGKLFDLSAGTGIYVNPQNWDKKNQKIKNVIEVKNKEEINSKLAKLKIEILDKFNLDYSNGEIIDKSWINRTVSEFFNQPETELKKENATRLIYLSDFAEHWITEKAPFYKVSASKLMDKKIIGHYKKCIELIREFEGKNKIYFKGITTKLMDDFSNFLTEKEYATETASRIISRFRFFCTRAENDENIKVNQNYKERVFLKERNLIKYKDPYFNEEEINVIFKKDLSYNETLDNARDNLIIGLWTGLRVSDFLTHLNTSNIQDGFIEIKTQKTKKWVSIPIHYQVQKILDKRFGILPVKIADQTFNKLIKNIAQICEFDELMHGAVMEVDKRTGVKRKKVGVYPKYKLVSSHICRRSFATNLFGKIPNSDICALGGWSKEDMMLKYIKKTNRESAMVLKKHWENN